MPYYYEHPTTSTPRTLPVEMAPEEEDDLWDNTLANETVNIKVEYTDDFTNLRSYIGRVRTPVQSPADTSLCVLVELQPQLHTCQPVHSTHAISKASFTDGLDPYGSIIDSHDAQPPRLVFATPRFTRGGGLL